MNPFKKLLGQTAIYGLSSIVGRLLNYLLVPLYTYVFKNPADYGDVSLLYAWVAFLAVILTFGMETTYFRFLHFKENKYGVYQNSFITILILNSIFLLIILIFNQSVANVLLFHEHNEYVVLLALIVFIDSINSIPLAKLRAEEKAFTFASIQIVSILFNIIFNLIFMLMFFNNERPEEGVFFILLINLFSSIIKSIFLFKNFTINYLYFDIHLIYEMLKYAFPLVIAGFAGIINETLDRILLERVLFLGGKTLHEAKTEVGIYSAVYKLAMLVTIFLQAYRYAAEPFFFAQSKSENKNEIYVKTMNYFIAGVCIVFLVVSLNIDIFKHFIRNESYWIGLNVVPILLFANICLGIYYNQSIWYKLSGQTKYGAFISIGGAIMTIVLNIIFIPLYGYLACAWATLIVYACQMISSYFLGQKFHPIPYNLKRFLLYVVLSIILFYLSENLTFESKYFSIFLKNLLIIFYMFVIYFVETNKSSKNFNLKNLFKKN